jgi:hypothetical protein
MTADEAWRFWLAHRPGGRSLRWETVREAFDAGVTFGRASEQDGAVATPREGGAGGEKS